MLVTTIMDLLIITMFSIFSIFSIYVYDINYAHYFLDFAIVIILHPGILL